MFPCVSSEDKNQLNKVSDAVKTNFNERHDEVRHIKCIVHVVNLIEIIVVTPRVKLRGKTEEEIRWVFDDILMIIER